ncbi:hypothetical protein Acsp04_15040 [Actinomadura sp. NBRC 104425]|nr:hypothetical protein Acsp04_15040 [Actinomadura sp. NBRC 104425]
MGAGGPNGQRQWSDGAEGASRQGAGVEARERGVEARERGVEVRERGVEVRERGVEVRELAGTGRPGAGPGRDGPVEPEDAGWPGAFEVTASTRDGLAGRETAARVVQARRMVSTLMCGSLLPSVLRSPDPVAHVDNRREPRAAAAARSTRALHIP